MTGTQPEPNELADLYEALSSVLDNLPRDTHPDWRAAIESVAFGGAVLDPKATCYGQQQAERNDFKISEYRERFGTDDSGTSYRTIDTMSFDGDDRSFLDNAVHVPVAPESKRALPLFVDENSLADALALLAEFPAEPAADRPGDGGTRLLATDSGPDAEISELETEPTDTASPERDVEPNELADWYDGLYQLYSALPNDVHPLWRAALEAVLFGNDFLCSSAVPYGEQQAERNRFEMPDYRAVYGDGERVTEFPAVDMRPPVDCDQYPAVGRLSVPAAPESDNPLLLDPDEEELFDAVERLAEFPAEPEADDPGTGATNLLAVDRLRDAMSRDPGRSDAEGDMGASSDSSAEATDTDRRTEHSPSGDSPGTGASVKKEEDGDSESSAVLRKEGPGEGRVAEHGGSNRQSRPNRKYDDSRAERAHRRAQQRDPADVVGLGETIQLVLQEVDFGSHPPTVMGKKSGLVVFLVDPPRHLSELDTIRAKVVGFGGKNNSAQAAFVGYDN